MKLKVFLCVLLGIIILSPFGVSQNRVVHPAEAAPKIVSEQFFIHTTNSSNTVGHGTTLDHSLLNGNPDAHMLVTPNWNPFGGSDGEYNDAVIATYYSGGMWRIYNEDLSPLQYGLHFNVYIASPYDTAFSHVHDASNGGVQETIIDHPDLNENQDAVPFSSHFWDPHQVYNDNTTAWGYRPETGSWSIFKDPADILNPMPTDAGFHVILPASYHETFVHTATAGNSSENFTRIDHPALNDNQNAIFFVEHRWDTDLRNYGNNSRANLGVFFDVFSNQWAIYDQGGTFQDMTAEAQFNIFIPYEPPLFPDPIYMRVTPPEGRPGDTLTIHGQAFLPGPYPGTLRWDRADRSTFEIPESGEFTLTFEIPADATPGDYFLGICALSPCASPPFDQSAEVSIRVLPPVSPAPSYDTLYGMVGDYLSVIDPTALTATPLVHVPGYTNFEGLTFHQEDGNFYTIANTHAPRLIRIHLGTETVTDIGPITLPGKIVRLAESITYHPDDNKLYASLGTLSPLSKLLVTLEPTTAEGTLLSTINAASSDDIDALVTIDGDLIMDDTISGVPTTSFLYTIDDPLTGSTSLIGPGDGVHTNDLAYLDQSETLFGVHRSYGLMTRSLVDGSVAVLGHLTASIAGHFDAIAAGPKPPNVSIIFVHTADSSNSSGHLTTLDHPYINADPDAKLIVTQNWNPSASSGVYNDHVIGLLYQNDRWHIQNQSGAPIPAGAAFNILVAMGDHAYVHTHTADNPGINETLLNHHTLNSRPEAGLLRTAVHNPSAGIGLLYDETTYPGYHTDDGRWAIFKEQAEEFLPMPAGAAFNLYLPTANDTVFRHQVTAANKAGNSTYLDHPQLNGNQAAVFFANAFWDDGLTRYFQNTRANIGIWYDTGEEKWAIFNQDRSAMNVEAQFIVVIPDQSNVSHTPLAVWHSWLGAEADLLQTLANQYPFAEIDVTRFDSNAALVEAIRAADEAEPDLIIGPDSLLDDLGGTGFGRGYCLPGECPECEGPNPPSWCRFASGGDFSTERIEPFMLAGLCLHAECPDCSGENPPRWCQAADAAAEIGPDIFQAAFLDRVDDQLYPIGIPVYWDTLSIGVNIAWFVERALPLPQTLDEILALHSDHPDLLSSVVPDETLENGEGLTAEFEALLQAVASEPNPQPNRAGLIITWSRQFEEVSGILGETPLLLPFDGYAPSPVVQGVMLNADSDAIDQAIRFADQFATAEVQTRLFESNGRLPTNPEAWHTLVAEPWRAFGEANLLGWVNQQPEIDLPTIIERPPFEPPVFENSPCGAAAAWLYTQIIAANGTAIESRVLAEYEAGAFEKICGRLLPDYGTDRCGVHAAYQFAQRFAELRGSPNAYLFADLTGRLSYTLCLASNLQPIVDATFGGPLHFPEVGHGLTLDIPSGLLSEPVNFIAQEGTLDPFVVLANVESTPVSIEAYTEVGTVVTRFDKPLTLQLGYDDNRISGVDEERLRLAYWDDQSRVWIPLNSVVDTVNNTVSAEVDRLTTFGVQMEEPDSNLIYLPWIQRGQRIDLIIPTFP